MTSTTVTAATAHAARRSDGGAASVRWPSARNPTPRHTRSPRRLLRLAALTTLGLAGLLAPHASASAYSAERALAARYAPLLVLKEQEAECDFDGEAYRPVAVETVLGNPDVVLRGPDGFAKPGPVARDLFGKGEQFFLDFPENPLRPRCDYERWFDRIANDARSTAYARVVAEAGEPAKLALQYWLYYVFNDWNNKHESDWEMIQIVFAAGSAREALTEQPTEIGYSQHTGAERADWTDSKLQKVGNRPVVYPGAGSHANYFSSSLWLGHSADDGFGCDDTRGPSRRLATDTVLLPAPPTSADDPFAWLTYFGLWGQRAEGPNNGPTGPNLKTQWSRPIAWSEDDWREASVPVPGRSLGPSATGFFCGAVAAGSHLYVTFLRRPLGVLVFLGVLIAAGVGLARRTTWSPVRPTPIIRRRSAGDIFGSARRIYAAHLRTFLGIGLAFLPLGALAVGLQQLVFWLTPFGSFVDVAHGDPLVASATALLVGGAVGTLVPAVLVVAASAIAVDRVAAGEAVRPLQVYRSLLPQLKSVAGSALRIAAVVLGLVVTVVGIPLAVAYLVRRSLTAQASVIERLGAGAAIGRSRELVAGSGWRVFAIAAVVSLAGVLTGPLVGTALLFLSSASLSAINATSSLVYAFTMPYVGISLALLFFDQRLRIEARPTSARAR